MQLPEKLDYWLSVVSVACPFPEDSSLSQAFSLVFLNGAFQNLSVSSTEDTCLQIVADVHMFFFRTGILSSCLTSMLLVLLYVGLSRVK